MLHDFRLIFVIMWSKPFKRHLSVPQVNVFCCMPEDGGLERFAAKNTHMEGMLARESLFP